MSSSHSTAARGLATHHIAADSASIHFGPLCRITCCPCRSCQVNAAVKQLDLAILLAMPIAHLQRRDMAVTGFRTGAAFRNWGNPAFRSGHLVLQQGHHTLLLQNLLLLHVRRQVILTWWSCHLWLSATYSCLAPQMAAIMFCQERSLLACACVQVDSGQQHQSAACGTEQRPS